MRRSFFKRSLSDGNLICESNSPLEVANERNEDSIHPLPDKMQGGSKGLSDSTPEISTCDTDASSYMRFVCIKLRYYQSRDLQLGVGLSTY